MRGQFFSDAALERLATELLGRYCRATERPLSAPISAEAILEQVLDDELGSPLWDSIPEPPGRTILAGLAPEHRLIVLNEDRRAVILGRAGQLNTLIAHEIGHWLLHVDRASLAQPTLLDGTYTLAHATGDGEPSTRDERNAHRFMAYLLLPAELLVPRARRCTFTGWGDVYPLRDAFDVTITVLRIRLEELGFLYIDAQGRFHRSRQEAKGQQRLL
jgi:hypothetical protein